MYLIVSIVMFKTLKLSGSFFKFSLSVRQMRMMKITKYDSCENIKHVNKCLLGSSLRIFGAVSPFLTGRNEVCGGRYL